ncbi:MAG: hypothetical protein AAF772_01645 [Acidobacteriota bacterium]
MNPTIRWQAALLGGALPVLLLGFLTSALANRTAFAVWALATALGHALLLHRGARRGWPGGVRLGLSMLGFAAAAAAFGVLVEHHRDALTRGLDAFLPQLAHPLWTQPSTGYFAAVALVLSSLLALLAAAPVRRPGALPATRRRRPPQPPSRR